MSTPAERALSALYLLQEVLDSEQWMIARDSALLARDNLEKCTRKPRGMPVIRLPLQMPGHVFSALRTVPHLVTDPPLPKKGSD